jgi:cytochrome c6
MEEGEMKYLVVTAAILLSVCLSATTGFCDTKKGAKIDGRKEFAKHCAVCHPDGGNVVNAQKSLKVKTLSANGVKSAKDIIGKIRNPGPGMTRFDEKTISNKEAAAIAEYIMKAFR